MPIATPRHACLREIWDRPEGRPVEAVKANVNVNARHIVAPRQGVLNESEEEYSARLALERVARDHQRLIERRPDEGAG